MKFLAAFVALFYSTPSLAHIKWFSDYGFEQPPLSIASVLESPYLWPLFALSVISLPIIVYLDRRAEFSKPYLRINQYLDRYSDNGRLIMRIAMGATLLMAWQAGSIIAPEIAVPAEFWGWFELALALLLLSKETTLAAGVGIMGLYVLGIFNHGIFHMLDYVIYPASGLYLVLTGLKSERLKNLGLPLLYSGLGFSLCWVAFEKLIYPYWGLSVLEQAPQLTMGLDAKFFLTATSFVEFTLGYLLIICLLQRPLAIVITIVFLVTTSFFGKTEVLGHTMLHGALLVFIVAGPGTYYQAPIRFHKSPVLRALFAAVNFVILFFALIVPYQLLATRAHARFPKSAEAAQARVYQLPEGVPAPKVTLQASADRYGGWNVHLLVENFKFSPESSGQPDVAGQGHAHLYLNGKKISRLYGDWFHINLPSGKNRLRVTLNTNNHEDYFSRGEVIAGELELVETRDGQAAEAHHH